MNVSNKTILITGVAGFIGFSLAQKLFNRNLNIIGVDNLNEYYKVSLKKERLKILKKLSNQKKIKFFFHEISLCRNTDLINIFEKYKPDIVFNLAAQAGVRYSIINPDEYIQSNIVGFLNILEACRKFNVEHLIYASSSSVYGGNLKLPFSEDDPVNHPISLYAATKKSNELMAHSYSHLYGIPSTGLRFFTVYGPWGRPDMAPMIFAKAILSNQEIKVFNYGDMSRDFTYIEDIVNALILLIDKPATIDVEFDPKNPSPSRSFAPSRIFNIGNNKPVNLKYFITLLENNLGKKAKMNFLELQKGDVVSTFADINKIKDWINFSPTTNIEDGVNKFCEWYKKIYVKI